jgi:hypothetical protein
MNNTNTTEESVQETYSPKVWAISEILQSEPVQTCNEEEKAALIDDLLNNSFPINYNYGPKAPDQYSKEPE